jgi:hypothetical protein
MQVVVEVEENEPMAAAVPVPVAEKAAGDVGRESTMITLPQVEWEGREEGVMAERQLPVPTAPTQPAVQLAQKMVQEIVVAAPKAVS